MTVSSSIIVSDIEKLYNAMTKYNIGMEEARAFSSKMINYSFYIFCADYGSVITTANIEVAEQRLKIPMLRAKMIAARRLGKVLVIGTSGTISIEDPPPSPSGFLPITIAAEELGDDTALRNRRERRHGRQADKKCWQQERRP